MFSSLGIQCLARVYVRYVLFRGGFLHVNQIRVLIIRESRVRQLTDNANVRMMSLHRADVIDFLSRKLRRKCPLLSSVLFGHPIFPFDLHVPTHLL